nr:phospholipase-like protein [Tanacetum cinerariifolium]
GDFCLITVFRFGKVNLDPDEEDHSEFRMCVFPKIKNLKGEHLLELVNKDVKFAKLDDEDDPFTFDVDGRTLEYGREDFCLITGFRFDKVNLDPNVEDHSEFRMRVFPKINNLKGEHLLELVNRDVKFAKLDDEDVVRVCFLLALDFVFMGHELRH